MIGFCAYLRSLEMSLDRSLKDKIDPLRDYFERGSIPKLRQVVERLSALGITPDITLNLAFPLVRRRELPSKWMGRMQWHLLGGIVINVNEIRSVYSALLKCLTELDRRQRVDPEIFAPIRLYLRLTVDILQESIPNAKLRGRIYRVKHLNENAVLRTESIESITGHRDWLVSGIRIKGRSIG